MCRSRSESIFSVGVSLLERGGPVQYEGDGLRAVFPDQVVDEESLTVGGDEMIAITSHAARWGVGAKKGDRGAGRERVTWRDWHSRQSLVGRHVEKLSAVPSPLWLITAAG